MRKYKSDTFSCGVLQLSKLWNDGNAYTVVKKILPRPNDAFNCCLVTWSDADHMGNGLRIAKEIRKTFPDTDLFESASACNPNSSNIIRMWVWRFDQDKVRKYRKKIK